MSDGITEAYRHCRELTNEDFKAAKDAKKELPHQCEDITSKEFCEFQMWLEEQRRYIFHSHRTQQKNPRTNPDDNSCYLFGGRND